MLSYSNTNNIGDTIQTLAVAQHVDEDLTYVDRDFMHQYNGDPVVVVMNGWFSHEPQNWPPSPKIKPIFFGFHMTPQTAEVYAKYKEYFHQFAPIGCRDQATADIMRSWGVESYVSGCATMTFPTRINEPDNPKTILVDQNIRHFLRHERRDFIKLTHVFPDYYSMNVKLAVAKNLMDYYRENAGLIITSRIHCAMPCAAMGINVVYTGIQEGRTAIVDTINIPKIKTKRFPRTRMVDIPSIKPAFNDVKSRIIADLHARLIERGIKVRMPS